MTEKGSEVLMFRDAPIAWDRLARVEMALDEFEALEPRKQRSVSAAEMVATIRKELDS